MEEQTLLQKYFPKTWDELILPLSLKTQLTEIKNKYKLLIEKDTKLINEKQIIQEKLHQKELEIATLKQDITNLMNTL